MPKTEKDLALGPPLKFYNNEITLQFSERDHIYYLVREDGSLEEQDGVTNSCNIIDHSLYLIPWAVKMTALKLLKTMPCSAEGNLEPIPWIQFENLVNEAKNARKEIFEDAGDVGTLAHKWLEDSIRWAITFGGGIVDEMNVLAPTDERAENCGKAGFAWMKSHNVRWIETERKIYSREYKYAGTLDGIALVDSCDDVNCCPRPYLDAMALVDWKSSNRLRTEYLYQTAGYLKAYCEEKQKPVTCRWILRLGKEDGKFEAWYEDSVQQDFEAFLACLNLKRSHEAVEKRMSDQKKIKTFQKKEEKKRIKGKKLEMAIPEEK